MPVPPESNAYSVRSFYTPLPGSAQGTKHVPDIAGQGPSHFADYVATGSPFSALKKIDGAQASHGETLRRIFASGLRGCGGSHMPLADKWQAALPHRPRYLVVNGMEGEPYTFKDYLLLRDYPEVVLEGIAISCALLGIREAYLVINGAYDACRGALEKTLAKNGTLFAQFDIRIIAGPEVDLYVLGEETALLNYLEGRRGEPRPKPPYPHEQGLWGRPTVINNVETLSWLPLLLTSPGLFDGSHPKLVTLLGDVARPGIYEVTLGERLPALLQRAGADNIAFVEVGGISGGLLPADLLDIAYEDEALRPLGLQVGSGTLRVFDASRDPLDEMRQAVEFFKDESCGRCTPCRVGTQELARFVGNLSGNAADSEALHWLQRVAHAMAYTSTCGLGRAAPAPLLTYLRHFTDTLDD